MLASGSAATPPFSGNLRYVLKLCLVAAIGLLASSRADAMGFSTANLGACAAHGCVVATGNIGPVNGEDFAAFVKAERVQPGAVVLLDSDGGDLVAALKLGGVIRRAGLSTAVAAYDRENGALKPATCASACAYVFLGGVERTVVRGGRLGVHQVFTRSGVLDASDAQWLASLIAVHVNKMGASYGVLTLAMSTAPTSMRWLTSRELVSLGMTTAAPAADSSLSRQTVAQSSAPPMREAALSAALSDRIGARAQSAAGGSGF